ncbi:MAG: FAD-dependent oxidoreductase, partial [Flavobacteriaceae bacterium]
MKPNNLPDYDIAVVGGGASGIYTAWRMLLEGHENSQKIKKWIKARGSLKIGVFESSDRIGGRVLSAIPPGLPDVVCEIGGMRYVSSQTLVRSLVENKLKLKRHQQAVDEPNNLCYLRGERLRGGDLTDPEKLPYNLSQEEKEWLTKVPYLNSAVDFLGYAVEKIFPDIKKNIGPNLRTWLKKEWLKNPLGLNPHKTPLYKIGLWNLIAPVLSHEAYKIAVTTVGYDCLGFNTNAVDTICELYDFVPGVKYSLLDEGFDSMLWTIQKEFTDKKGEVHLNHGLKRFDETKLADGTAGVTLHFSANSAKKAKGKIITARAIVLAMPQRSIRLLDPSGPVLDPERAPKVQFLLNAVEPIHLYKMFIAYDNPWWEKVGVTEGRSLTD